MTSAHSHFKPVSTSTHIPQNQHLYHGYDYDNFNRSGKSSYDLNHYTSSTGNDEYIFDDVYIPGN